MALLAPLSSGCRIPWRLDALGEPEWLTVVAVLSSGHYAVRYPDGHHEELHDTEEDVVEPDS